MTTGWKNTATREVRLSADYQFGDYEDYRVNYIDPKKLRPIARTKFYVGDELNIEVNSLSCFGPEPDPDLPVIGFFGDSVTQGRVLFGCTSVPLQTRAPGFQTINGGIEGSNIEKIVDHCLYVNAQRPLACAVVHPGWHNLVYGDNRLEHWREQLDRLDGLPRVAHIKLTGDLNDEAAARGIDHLYNAGEPGNPDGLDVYHKLEMSGTTEKVAILYGQVNEKNAFLEDYCRAKGRLFIDLDPVLKPKTYADLKAHFFDTVHPRYQFYPTIAHAVSVQLGPFVQGAVASATAPSDAEGRDPRQDHGANYPLW